jgi:hypothetical protein
MPILRVGSAVDIQQNRKWPLAFRQPDVDELIRIRAICRSLIRRRRLI